MGDSTAARFGQLPETWHIRKVGELCSVGTGGTPNTKFPEYYEPPAVNWIKSGDVKGFYIDRADHKISQAGMENSAATPHPPGTVLMAMSGRGKTRATTAILRITAACSQSVAAIMPAEKINSEFLHLQFIKRYSEIRGITGSDDRSGLNMSLIRDIDLIVPPLREQEDIAHILASIHRSIEQQHRLLQLNTELKTVLLRRLFTQGLRGDERKETEIGQVPQSWEQRPLEEAGDVVYGIQAAVAANLKPIGTKILTNKNIALNGEIVLDAINYFVLKTKRHHETVLKKGDLLFNWRSGSKEHVGKTAYFDLDGEFTHSSFILRIRPQDRITGRYLYYYLNFLRESGYFLKSQTFSVNAKFNKSAINRLPTYLPSDDERREIVIALDALGEKIEAVRTKKRLLQELFRTLLHELMTAQIRVPDLDLPELEAAAAE